MIEEIRGYFAELFRDPMTTEGKFFVDATTINAIVASRNLFLEFDELRKADIAQSDFLIAVSSIHVGLAQLGLSQIDEAKKTKLKNAIVQSVKEWNGQNAERALADCRAFFEKNYPTIMANSEKQEFAGSDTLGFWIVWNLIGQSDKDQRKLIRTAGALSAVPFSKWWNAKEIDQRIRPGFPWPSFLSLLYPVAAVLNGLTYTPMPPAIFLWTVGIANLGYLLVGAGIFAGTFRIFGLQNRWQVFSAAGLFLAIAFVLSNPHVLPVKLW